MEHNKVYKNEEIMNLLECKDKYGDKPDDENQTTYYLMELKKEFEFINVDVLRGLLYSYPFIIDLLDPYNRFLLINTCGNSKYYINPKKDCNLMIKHKIREVNFNIKHNLNA